MKNITLGSLFDGSGGFPLAGILNGITPLWASEIEPFPIRVTAKRIPTMKHYGDVQKINGAKLEPVDIITFGSPCQDMSIAGKRSGIHDGERSNLFFEAIRIIREMRGITNGKYPRYAVWENVPGAYSSNKGDDFRCILEAFCQISDESVSIPMPKKWHSAGFIRGNGYSVAWRMLDAQYWRVPQRRRRIYLVADFGGERADEILFECESMSRDSQQGCSAGQSATANASGSAGGSGNVRFLNPLDCQSRRVFLPDGCCPTFPTIDGNEISNIATCYPIDQHQQDARFRLCEDGVVPTMTSHMGTGGNNTPMILGRFTYIGNGQLQQITMKDIYNTLDCIHDKQAVLTPEKSPRRYIVRRLTPTECARLQGFPDWWCADLKTENPSDDEIELWKSQIDEWRIINGKCPVTRAQVIKWLQNPESDTAQYKLWGNGVALPCVQFILSGIVKQQEFVLDGQVA